MAPRKPSAMTPASTLAAAPGNARSSIDTELEQNVRDFRLQSVSMNGLLMHWHILAHKAMTVGALIRAIASRSQVTREPLREKYIMLAETVNGRIFRLWDEVSRLEEIRNLNDLVAFEVPTLDSDGTFIELDSLPHGADFFTVVCHTRHIAEAGSYFTHTPLEDVGVRVELEGVPIVFRARAGLSQGHLHGFLEQRYYRPATCFDGDISGSLGDSTSQAPFSATMCQASSKGDRLTMEGGFRIVPCSEEPAPFQECGGDPKGGGVGYHKHFDGNISIVAEWQEGSGPTPWCSLQQTVHTMRQESGRFIEAILGLDVADLVKQNRLLHEELGHLDKELTSIHKFHVAGEADLHSGSLGNARFREYKTNMTGMRELAERDLG